MSVTFPDVQVFQRSVPGPALARYPAASAPASCWWRARATPGSSTKNSATSWWGRRPQTNKLQVRRLF